MRVLAVVLSMICVSASLAFAKPPAAEELPSLEAIHKKADAQWKDELRRAAEAKRDPVGDAIEAYSTKQIALNEYQQLVDVILNTSGDMVEAYRRQATEALIQRFEAELLQDPEVRRVRRSIGLKLIPLMRSREKLGREFIEQILYAWWRPKAVEYQYRSDAKSNKRSRAYNKMKKYLEKDDS